MSLRETIVSSGGSTAVNNAITALAALGGGVVRLDGLIDMDADINMASNVYLMGHGPGTGLRNNTADNYEINFTGTSTAYNIAAPVNGRDYFTCDTAAEATNFVAGETALLVDATGSPRECQLVYIKTTGVGATGTVEIYEDIDSLVGYGWNAATVAHDLTPVKNSGLIFMDVVASSTGTLIVDIDYSHDLRFENVRFDESRFTIDYSGNITLYHCDMFCENVLNFTSFIALGEYLDGIFIESCKIRGALSGIDWTGITHLRRLDVSGCEITGCQYPINLTPATTTDALAYKISLSNNIISGESPASGGGSSIAIYTTGWVVDFNVQSNIFTVVAGTVFSSASISDLKANYNWFIDGNEFSGTAQTLISISKKQIWSNNVFGGAHQMSNGVVLVSFTGNYLVGQAYFQTSASSGVEECTISGNTFDSAVTISSTAAKPAIDNVISANRFGGAFSISEDGTGNVINGNTFGGNVTIGGGASDVNNRTVFVGNALTGNLVFTEPDQDDCVISGNAITGTVTALTGTGCEVDNSTTAYTKEISGTLSQANLIAMNGTPVSLLAAPAAGYTHIIDEIELFHDYDTAVYTGGGDVSIKYDASTVIALADVTIVTGNADAKRVFRPTIYQLDASTGTGTGFDTVTDAAKAIVITNADAAFADGNAANIIKYKIKYHTIKLLS